MPTLRPLAIISLLLLTACGRLGRTVPPAGPVPVATDAENAAPPGQQKAQPAAEMRVSVCALAPASAAGVRTLDAVYRAGDRDTFAVIDDRRVPLEEAVGDVRLAGQTDWFLGKRPLEVPPGTAAPRRFAIYDVGRIIEGGQPSYLGTVDALPVFAAAADIAPVQPQLTKLLETQKDLPRMLVSSPVLRAAFRRLEVVYVPLRATGCVFQPMVRAADRPARPATPAPTATPAPRPAAPDPPARTP